MEGDVVVVKWPADRALWESLVESGRPVLAVVAEGAKPPTTSDCCHDWMWATGGQAEMRYRLRAVALRAGRHRLVPPHIDEHGLLSFAMRDVALSNREQQLASVLVDHFGAVVSKDELDSAVRPGRLAILLSRLRRRLAPIGLAILTVPGPAAGYVMRVAPTVSEEAPGQAFDQELGDYMKDVKNSES